MHVFDRKKRFSFFVFPYYWVLPVPRSASVRRKYKWRVEYETNRKCAFKHGRTSPSPKRRRVKTNVLQEVRTDRNDGGCDWVEAQQQIGMGAWRCVWCWWSWCAEAVCSEELKLPHRPAKLPRRSVREQSCCDSQKQTLQDEKTAVENNSHTNISWSFLLGVFRLCLWIILSWFVDNCSNTFFISCSEKQKKKESRQKGKFCCA